MTSSLVGSLSTSELRPVLERSHRRIYELLADETHTSPLTLGSPVPERQATPSAPQFKCTQTGCTVKDAITPQATCTFCGHQNQQVGARAAPSSDRKPRPHPAVDVLDGS